MGWIVEFEKICGIKRKTWFQNIDQYSLIFMVLIILLDQNAREVVWVDGDEAGKEVGAEMGVVGEGRSCGVGGGMGITSVDLTIDLTIVDTNLTPCWVLLNEFFMAIQLDKVIKRWFIVAIIHAVFGSGFGTILTIFASFWTIFATFWIILPILDLILTPATLFQWLNDFLLILIFRFIHWNGILNALASTG